MKKTYKSLSMVALSGLFCLSLSLSANAQHSHNGGGSGGGGTSNGGGGGGGGSVSRSAPAPAPSQPSPSYSGHSSSSTPSRPAVSNNNNNQRPAPSRVNQSGNVTQHTYGITRQNNIGTRRVGVTANQAYSGHAGNINRNNNNPTAQSYRSYQGSVYGKNHPGSVYNNRGNSGYLPGRTSYHYNHGYYGSYYYPRLGFSIGYLPFGYYPFYYGDYQYFYSGGLFYQYNNDQYTVVEPPVGAEVTTLPANAQSIVINGQQYYEVNGVYYQPITKDDGTLSYQVAGKDGELNTDDQSVDNAPPAPQIGDIVTELPPNCRKININGDKLYLSPDGVYYKAQLDQDNNKVYKIVGLPADEDQNQQQGGN